MKNRFLAKSDLPIVTALLMITTFLVSLNSNSLGNLTSNFIDSGSIFSDYMNMTSKPMDFDQQRHWHTGFYGGIYNQIQLFVLLLIKLIYAQKPPLHLLIIVARLISAVFSIASVVVFRKILREIRIERKYIEMATGALLTMPGFFKFLYEIHPESAGLFFALLGIFFYVKLINDDLSSENFYFIFFFSLLAVLAKASFLPYMLLPLHAWWRLRGVKNVFLSSKLFFILPILAIFISNPFILLKPYEWVSRQISIQMYFHTINLSLATSVQSWFDLVINQLFLIPILVFGILSMVISVRTSNQTQLNLVFSLFCIIAAEFIMNIWVVRFTFQTHYFYPVYPLAIFIVVIIINRVNLQFAVKILLLISFLITLVINSIITSSQIMRDINFKSSVQFESVQLFQNLPKTNLAKVTYSASLPIDFDNQIKLNSFQYGDSLESIAKKLAVDSPDFILIDQSCGYCNSGKFLEASENLGYRIFKKIRGITLFDLKCTVGGNSNIFECVKQFDLLLNLTSSQKIKGEVLFLKRIS